MHMGVALTVIGGSAASAEEFTAQHVFDEFARADGSVAVLMAGEVDPRLVVPLMQTVAAGGAESVRIGVAADVPGRQALLEEFTALGSDRVGWDVCSDWLTPMWDGDTRAQEMSSFLQETFGGSIVVLDNGPNDRERFHPAIGEDPFEGQAENPIFHGLFHPEAGWSVIEDPDDYRAAWQTLDGLPRGQDVNGC